MLKPQAGSLDSRDIHQGPIGGPPVGVVGASPHGHSRAKSPRSEDLGPSAGCPSSMLGQCAYKVQGSGLRVSGSGRRVQGSGLRVQGVGFRSLSDRAVFELGAWD